MESTQQDTTFQDTFEMSTTPTTPTVSVRLLKKTDYYKGFLDVLKQLTPVHSPSYNEFCQRLDTILEKNPSAEIYVIELQGEIVATGKIMIEMKLHNYFTNMGHIEDVVVRADQRGNGVGKVLIKFLRNRAKELRCYKVVLDCGRENVEFYQKCGFKKKGQEMVAYF